MRERLSRREALAAGLAGAAGLALVPAAAAARDSAGEREALTELMQGEQDAVFVYRNAALGGAATIARQDLEHARALATHVQAVGLKVPGTTRDRAGLPAEALAVLEAGGDAARRQAAMAYERSLIAGCAQRLGALQDPDTVRTVATVMAGHAQHLVLLELMKRR
jgi:hypothetical protein